MPSQQSILNQMQHIIDRWQGNGDARAIFLNCYQMMTANVLTAVDDGEFYNPGWVNELLHCFAGYYFAALDDYEKRSARTPAVWKAAFDTAASPEQQALQKLIAGVNAHINYDLVLTLVDMLQSDWNNLSGEQREQRYMDHCHVNDVIGQTIDSVQDQIIEPISPGMTFVDTALGPLDEWMTSRLITLWREEVWRNALSYLEAANATERARQLQEIEASTLKRASAITLSSGVFGLRHLL